MSWWQLSHNLRDFAENCKSLAERVRFNFRTQITDEDVEVFWKRRKGNKRMTINHRQAHGGTKIT